jgi:hypothetical protein
VGELRSHPPILLILAAFSRHEQALDWARERAESVWGPVAAASERFAFEETTYYESSMGAGLRKQFLAFQPHLAPEQLPQIKLDTNRWEQEFSHTSRCPELRPLNLDPGYLTLAKLVLASTKDHAHRIYLSQGIFAEVTLNYRDGQWQPLPWTFPDYRRADYHAFFQECRALLKRRPPMVAAD